jgi:hypothetical protein
LSRQPETNAQDDWIGRDIGRQLNRHHLSYLSGNLTSPVPLSTDPSRDSRIVVKLLTLCGFCSIQRGRYNIGEKHVA